jgi:hypothetical protein
MQQCERCNHNILPYERAIYLQDGTTRELLCTECFSKKTALLVDIELEEFSPHTIEIKGRGRSKHLFYICRMVHPMGFSLEAIEIKDGQQKGYKTSVRGDLDCDQVGLYEKLIKKTKKMVSRKYIELKSVGWEKRSLIKEDTVVGRIEWDEHHHGRLPLVIIDGKEYTWEELGVMLMTFDGWDFKLKILEDWEDEE